MIGILGGTFDPVHYGHLRPAREVQQALALEQIRVIPAGEPPHRTRPAASANQRLDMVELALVEFPGFILDDREIHRPGPSYAVLTLDSLRAEFGERPLCLIMGMDTFLDLETWHQWQRLPELAHLIVMQRPGWPVPRTDDGRLPAWAHERVVSGPDDLAHSSAGRVLFYTVTLQDISASNIRAGIARGGTVQTWLPPAVWDYIRTHGLYGGRELDRS